MARCGCGGTCSCVVEGEAPIQVSGNGSPQNPYVVSFGEPGEGCSAVAECVGQAAGPGLVYDEGSGLLQVKISGDDGNATRFGSDGGIYTPGEDAPVPTACYRSVDGLPAAPSVVGADALAGLHNPYNSPYEIGRAYV